MPAIHQVVTDSDRRKIVEADFFSSHQSLFNQFTTDSAGMAKDQKLGEEAIRKMSPQELLKLATLPTDENTPANELAAITYARQYLKDNYRTGLGDRANGPELQAAFDRLMHPKAGDNFDLDGDRFGPGHGIFGLGRYGGGYSNMVFTSDDDAERAADWKLMNTAFANTATVQPPADKTVTLAANPPAGNTV